MKIGVFGATGLVGQHMLTCLAEAGYPVGCVVAAASDRSVGLRAPYGAQEVRVISVEALLAAQVDYVLFAVEAELSREWAPRFVEGGAVVIDNSSAWRMDPQVPLVIPEVNFDTVAAHRLIANPNCSTIQLVAALAPIHRVNPVVSLRVATYQAVSGSGIRGLNQLREERQGRVPRDPFYGHPIEGNCLPHCDAFEPSGYTKEEMKLVNETKKILRAPQLRVSATAVRVPVEVGHSEVAYFECAQPITPGQVQQLLSRAEGIKLVDDPQRALYPTPLAAVGQDRVLVGRVRQDLASPTQGISFWVVADNLRKGAAANAVQILRRLQSPTDC